MCQVESLLKPQVSSTVVLIGLSNMPSRVTFKTTGKFYSSSDRIK